MLLEMDLETTIYVTGIAVLFFQCFRNVSMTLLHLAS